MTCLPCVPGGSLSDNLKPQVIDQLLRFCDGLPLALTMLGRLVGREGANGVAKAEQEAVHLTAGGVGRIALERLYEIVGYNIKLLPAIHQMAFFDVAFIYAPAKLPWDIVEDTLVEGGPVTYSKVGNRALSYMQTCNSSYVMFMFFCCGAWDHRCC
jgi:hypothetical protein